MRTSESIYQHARSDELDRVRARHLIVDLCKSPLPLLDPGWNQRQLFLRLAHAMAYR